MCVITLITLDFEYKLCALQTALFFLLYSISLYLLTQPKLKYFDNSEYLLFD